VLLVLTACTININVNVPPTPAVSVTPPAAPRGTATTGGQLTAPTGQASPGALRPAPDPQAAALPPGPAIAGCPIFPGDHIWNTRVDTLPVAARSDDYVDAIGREVGLHPDFGSGLWEGSPIGIPFNVVEGGVPPVSFDFEYAEESDPGPYPIPDGARIEAGSDRHLLVVDSASCVLYELYAAEQDRGTWLAGSGAIWDLRGYGLRPESWTSADAAGLPILPGLVRYEEVAAGEIRHAIRFTAESVRGEFIWPARHEASDDDDPARPPFGQRFRLKATFDSSPYPPEVQVILQAMKTYGLILADNGSNWYITGAPDERWDNDMLVPLLREVTGEDFEAVDAGGLMIAPDSGQARRP
jgi:hypothetical protein